MGKSPSNVRFFDESPIRSRNQSIDSENYPLRKNPSSRRQSIEYDKKLDEIHGHLSVLAKRSTNDDTDVISNERMFFEFDQQKQFSYYNTKHNLNSVLLQYYKFKKIKRPMIVMG